MSARRVSSSPNEGHPLSVRKGAVMPSGKVLFEGRVAEIAGFDGGAVKLRFADGGTASVALADYVLQARAVRPRRGADVSDAAAAVPWQPTGQRARHVRMMLDGYTAGRRAALHELRKRVV